MNKRSNVSPYVAHVTAFFRAVINSQQSHAAVHLHAVLLAEMNRANWPATFEMSDRMMAVKVCMTPRTLVSARKELIDARIIDCTMKGTGSKACCVYRLLTGPAATIDGWGRGSGQTSCAPSAVMPNGSTNSVRPLNGTGVLKTKDLYKDQEEREKEKTESLSLAQVPAFLMSQTEWLTGFCYNNGVERRRLQRYINKFVLQLQNQGITYKEKRDVIRHFGAWYNRLDIQQFTQMERQIDLEEQRRFEAEKERQEEIQKKEMEEKRSKEAYRRTYEEAKRRAAEGDEFSINWLKKAEEPEE